MCSSASNHIVDTDEPSRMTSFSTNAWQIVGRVSKGPDRGWGPFETSMYVNAGGSMGRAISMLHTNWFSLCINILSYQPTSDRLTRTTSPITPFEWVAPNRGGLSLLMLLVARTSSE